MSNSNFIEDVFDVKRLTMAVLMTPDMVNFKGKVHGGDLLKLLDQVAYACGTRYCGDRVVTLSVDRVTFDQPIEIGFLVTFLACVNYVGNSSLEVGIKVIAEDLQKRLVYHSNSCYFTMVCVDETGKPKKAPPLTPQTPDEIRRYKEAEERRKMRLKLKNKK